MSSLTPKGKILTVIFLVFFIGLGSYLYIKNNLINASYRPYYLTNGDYRIDLQLPKEYEAREWVTEGYSSKQTSIYIERKGTTNQPSLLDIVIQANVEKSRYCHFGWCDLEAKSTIETPVMQWEYLGDSTYCDVGECGEFNNIYRAQNGDYTVYVVSDQPIDAKNSEKTPVQIVFDSIQFKQLIPYSCTPPSCY